MPSRPHPAGVELRPPPLCATSTLQQGTTLKEEEIRVNVKKLTVKVYHIDAHVPKSQANKEHHNIRQIKLPRLVSEVDLDWQHKGCNEALLLDWMRMEVAVFAVIVQSRH
ncbi:hypothetical protein HGM15179_020458 [Zosterops borbonicus]|uniref:Uncharacterized protein n=1 Tax=Zosterops borbonicus TaxID=364589 RepID=A0A8K1D7X6_9PASS|nr:hypothetical protein HGM15179_020458 [Zosterops borbonicus]